MKAPIIKGKNVALRPMSLRDAGNFCSWLSDTEVSRFLSCYENPPSLREERKWILSVKRRGSSLYFSLDTFFGEHIGLASLVDIDSFHKSAEFYIFIGDKKYLGQGFGTEAARLVLSYGFKKFKLHRVFLSAIAYNIRGIKSYKKVGFQIEGRLRDHIYRDGVYHDIIKMGILNHEFFKINKIYYGKRK